MKIQKKLNKIKYLSFKLKEGGQMPFSLFKRICNLTEKDSEEKLQFYADLCESYIRIKGYYFKYPELDLTIDKDIQKLCDERGY